MCQQSIFNYVIATISQSLSGSRTRSLRKIKRRALQKCPQKAGVITKVFITTPRKPCSARRATMRIRLTTKQEVMCHINGEKHQLKKFGEVLIYGKNVADLPGLRYRAVRTLKKRDFKPIYTRMTARSKYGARNSKRLKKIRKTRGKGEVTYA